MKQSETRTGEPMDMGQGRMFWPLDPRPDEVQLDDIAHGLANLCRFGGRCRTFYSVAQHSLHVARLVAQQRPEWAIYGLLHDAAEAYLGDMVTPLKRAAQFAVVRFGCRQTIAFQTAENAILRCVWQVAGVPELAMDAAELVARCDHVALATEARDLMGDPRWQYLPHPDPTPIEPMAPDQARQAFLDALGCGAKGLA